MRKLISAFLLLLITMTAAAVAEGAPAGSPAIRVGIWSGQTNIILSAEADYSVADTATAEKIASFRAKEKITVTVKDAGIAINGKPVAARGIAVTLPEKSAAAIEVNKRQYRGGISLHRTAGRSGLTVVNTLPVEEYLYGIIAREISPAWPPEAIKAQAVAARTYAIYSLGKHKDDGYDVCASTDCQVYGGKTAEDARASQAVNDTFGLIATYQGRAIPAYFHGSGGGHTENSENVWGGYVPALRGVVDFDDKSPHYKWEKQMTPGEVEAALQSAGYNIGILRAIELSPLTKPPVKAPDRGVSGRLKEIRFIGSSGSVLISGAKVRTILGLNSTLFDIAVILPSAKELDVEITDSYGGRDNKTIQIKAAPLPEKGIADKPNQRRIGGRTNETIVFSGAGWGHGLGLSQWGAKAMAEKAPPGDKTYFRQILKHYYTGIDINKIY